MRDTAACNHRFDALSSDESSVLVVVIAAVTEQSVGPSSWSSDQAGDRWDLLKQWQELSDVVTVPAGQRNGERVALAVDEDVVVAARTRAVDRARPTFRPLRAALTWEESITARDQSICFAARS